MTTPAGPRTVAVDRRRKFGTADVDRAAEMWDAELVALAEQMPESIASAFRVIGDRMLKPIVGVLREQVRRAERAEARADRLERDAHLRDVPMEEAPDDDHP